MIDRLIGNSDMALNSQIPQQQDLSPVEKNSVPVKNPYKKVESKDLVDQIQLSKEALKAYQEYKDQEKYKQVVVNAVNDGLTTNEIINLINSGEYLNNDDLAESLLNNAEFQKDIFSQK